MRIDRILALVAAVAFLLAIGGLAGCQQEPEPQPDTAVDEPEPPRVGCTACHVKVDEERNYTLGHEALGVEGHPTAGTDGTPITDDTPFAVCMDCHATAASGKGVAASVPMALMAHPAHMFSDIFDRYDGNCWSCHTVDAEGTFLVITEKVDVTMGGIPTALPIDPSKIWVPREGMMGQ